MLDIIPGPEQMTALVGTSLYGVWKQLCALIEERYEMDPVWGKGGKAWTYEYKYRRGGKTYARYTQEKTASGLWSSWGKRSASNLKKAGAYTEEVQRVYEEAQTYHDGKWMMFEPTDTALFDDFIRLLGIKRRPNRT